LLPLPPGVLVHRPEPRAASPRHPDRRRPPGPHPRGAVRRRRRGGQVPPPPVALLRRSRAPAARARSCVSAHPPQREDEPVVGVGAAPLALASLVRCSALAALVRCSALASLVRCLRLRRAVIA